MNQKQFSFQKTYTLLPQSPLIHFQHDQKGAVLRATEVKPKLDRYIARRYGKELPEGWRNPQSPDALNYKMRIVESGRRTTTMLGFISGKKASTAEEIAYANQGCPYDIFYGNVGTEHEKRGVTVAMKLTINCFADGLLNFINSIIGDFFIVHNFGTMQDKGFGSFIVPGKTYTETEICKILREEYHAAAGYYFHASGKPFKQIKCVYSLMKSGLNLKAGYRPSILFKYMHKQEIGNEKAWLKQQKIAPAVVNHTQTQEEKNTQHDAKSRYVRALLGVGEAYEFQNYRNESPSKIRVKIQETGKNEKKIERLNSPVFFKIIGKTVYFVGAPVNEEIYGKTFRFSSTRNRQPYSGTITVPSKNELPDNFMDDFMHYAYIKLNEWHDQFPDIRGITIEEVQ